jgi:uncharacterized protein (TIGR00661 family)
VRILYGVAGEGMGHATRSHAFLTDIVGDHDVLIVASGRAHDYLARHFPQVREILGFSLAYEDNAIRRWETVAQNLRGAVSGWPAQVRSFYEVARDFAPDVVVSDFESFVLTVARRERVPAISVDNIMMLDRCRHDEDIIRDDVFDFELARQIARTKAAGLHHAIVPTFFRPPLRRKATTLVAPVLREAVLAAVAEQGEHLLVYQTATGSESLVAALHETGLPCRVYGVRRDLDEDVVDGLLVFRPFSEPAFLDDLRTARAVVAGGGFSLLSECVYLHKPALSIPVGGQFEQTLNARYLARLGYGEYAEAPTPQAIGAFLERLPAHAASLAEYAQDGNNEALAALREQLAFVALEHGGRRRARRSAAAGDGAGAPPVPSDEISP